MSAFDRSAGSYQEVQKPAPAENAENSFLTSILRSAQSGGAFGEAPNPVATAERNAGFDREMSTKGFPSGTCNADHFAFASNSGSGANNSESQFEHATV
jgi:hypothetical protein